MAEKLLAELAGLVPGAAGLRMPFAIGMKEVLLALPRRDAEVTDKDITGRLKSLVSSNGYLRALAAKGSQRHDINGQPVGEVALGHRLYARRVIKTREAARKASVSTAKAKGA